MSYSRESPDANSDPESERSGVALRTLAEALGRNVIDILAGRFQGSRRVSQVVIFDPLDDRLASDEAIMIGVGINGGQPLADLIAAAIEQRAVAVIVRERLSDAGAALNEAANAGLSVLGISASIPWSQVATTLTNAIDQRQALSSVSTGALPVGGRVRDDGLVRIADTLSAVLQSPITIEDLNSRVLAFSGDQELGDACRKETILRGQVPSVYTEKMKVDGVFDVIYGSPTPVYFETGQLLDHELSRMVARMMAGGRVLGSIWVAVHHELDDDMSRLLMQAANEAAAILDRASLQGGRASLLRRQHMSTLIDGGSGADELAVSLGLTQRRFCLIHVSVLDGAGADDENPHIVQHVAEVLNLRLQSVSAAGFAADIDDRVFGILPVTSAVSDAFAVDLIGRFIGQVERRTRVHVALSPVLSEVGEIAEARKDTAKTLAAITAIGGPRVSRSGVWRVSDTLVDVALLELRDRMRDKWRAIGSPVQALVTYDRRHGTDFTETLEAHLDCFGAVIPAAESLHVHPNTLRYRLKRIREISNIDVFDADSRFSAMLELRMLRLDDRGFRAARRHLRAVDE